MHGLVNRAIQCFLRDTYGQSLWHDVCDAAGLDQTGFEAMLVYSDDVTARVLTAAGDILDKGRDTLLEDLGTYLVSHPNTEALRRLLRFGGESFVDFLHSLDDLPGRARLAVPDLDLPSLELRDHVQDTFQLSCRWHHPGFGHVMVGILRALADDYGTLALLDHQGTAGPEERISIRLMESDFSSGRSFDLAAGL